MIELRVKNYKQITEEENKINYSDDYKINGIKIDEDVLGISNIPSISVKDVVYYYINKNNSDYIISASYNLIKTFIITFVAGKNGVEIGDIELSIKFADRFKNYIVASNEMFSNALKFELTEILNYLPFTEKEKEWYKSKIQQYIDKYIGTKMVSLSGGFINLEDFTTPTLTISNNNLQFPMEFNGKTYENLKEICKDYEVSYSTVWSRINEKGWNLEKAIYTEPAPKGKSLAKYHASKKYIKPSKLYDKLIYNGKQYSLNELAQEAGIPRSTLYGRLQRGWDIERAIREDLHQVGKNILK